MMFRLEQFKYEIDIQVFLLSNILLIIYFNDINR